MALTFFPFSGSTSAGLGNIGSRKVAVGYLIGDASYPTGGYTLDPTEVGMSFIDQMYCGVGFQVNQAMRFTPVAGGGGKVQAFTPASGVELANATNTTAFFPVLVVGV
ncbi:MAG: hypothetical protein ACREQ5_04750 [Candidatus Dormibacteria bacterium]